MAAGVSFLRRQAHGWANVHVGTESHAVKKWELTYMLNNRELGLDHHCILKMQELAAETKMLHLEMTQKNTNFKNDTQKRKEKKSF